VENGPDRAGPEYFGLCRPLCQTETPQLINTKFCMIDYVVTIT
jgi:hypothetical protein